MWVFRYLLPGIIMILLGGFAFQNLNQKVTVRFLYREFYDLPVILIIAIAFVSGILIRYLAVFTNWVDKKRLENEKRKLFETKELGVSAITEGDIPTVFKEVDNKRIYDEKEVENKAESKGEG